MPEENQIYINGQDLSLEEVVKVAKKDFPVELTEEVKTAIQANRKSLEDMINQSKQPLYGITTGFGQLVDKKIPENLREQLQENLINSHSAGVGERFPNEIVRAALLLRVNSLARGFSGVRLKVVTTIIKMLNKGVHPYVPEKGSVGASGDLAPLAHMASVLIGEGKASYKGNLLSGEEAMHKAGIPPLELKEKEGLALINGTQFMTSILALVSRDFKGLVRISDLIGALSFNVLGGNTKEFKVRVQKLRPYPEIIKVAENLRSLTGSQGNNGPDKSVQDPYSLRCIPQVHGSVRMALNHVLDILKIEMNSVTDNPLVFSNPEEVLTGGNFHGEPLAMAADYLKIASTEMGSISERRTNQLLHPSLNGDLPSFLAENPGVESGLMLPQYTAASLVSENKTLAHPDSVDSIPVSGDQEDHVSMGVNSVRHLEECVENLKYILSVELLAASRGATHRYDNLSKPQEKIVSLVKEVVPFLETETEKLSRHIDDMYELIDSSENWLSRLGEQYNIK